MKLSKTLTAIACICFTMFLAIGTMLSTGPVDAKLDHTTIVLTESNFVAINGPIDSASIAQAQTEFAQLIAKRGTRVYPIYLVLNTPGGDVHAGLRLYEFLKTYQNIETITLESASMGAILVQYIQGQRLMIETGTLMYHRMSLGMTPAELPKAKSRILSSENLENEVMAKVGKRLNKSVDELRKQWSDEVWLRADRALSQKYIDSVVSIRCNEYLLATTKTEVVPLSPFLPMPVTKVTSKCPLLN